MSPIPVRSHQARLPLLLLALAGCGAEESPRPAASGAGTAAAPPEAPASPQATGEREDRPRVVFFGDSLTAGFGLRDGDPFPVLIQRRLQEEGLPHRVVEAGTSGDTTADGVARLDWLLREPAEAVVLALGANDGLRGVPVAEIEQNLTALIRGIRQRAPAARILLAGMQMPPNLGPDYCAAFAALYPRVAEAEGVELLPFLLEGVAGDPALNQADGIHPNAEGHRRVAEHVWQALEPLLRAGGDD